MRVVVILALLLIPGLVVAAPPAFVGTWKLASVRTKDGPVPKDKLAGGGMTWEFKADGSLAMTVWKGKESVTAKGTWTVEGNTIAVNESGQINKMTFKRTGSKLEIAGTGASTVVMTFSKSK
jgi:hypothetical protein